MTLLCSAIRQEASCPSPMGKVSRVTSLESSTSEALYVSVEFAMLTRPILALK